MFCISWRYEGEADSQNLALELFQQKCTAQMVRDHPEFPQREDLRQVKVYDMEEEVSESEDENETGAVNEAESHNGDDSEVETVFLTQFVGNMFWSTDFALFCELLWALRPPDTASVNSRRPKGPKAKAAKKKAAPKRKKVGQKHNQLT